MASTRFFRPNDNKFLRYTTGTFPRIINGDSVNYASPPALVQDAQYPMSNLNLPSRYTPWMIPAGSASPINLQIDLGSNQSIVFGGFFAVRHFGSPVSIGYDFGLRTTAQGYLNTTYTSVASGTVSSSSRDQGAIFPVTGLGRYWQITLTAAFTNGISIGAIALCVAPQDLGYLYSPGMGDSLIHPAIQSRTGSGHLSVVSVGDDRRLISMPFDNIPDADRAKIDLVFGSATFRDPAIWLDRSDIAKQVVLSGDGLRWEHIFDAPNLWSTDLNLEVLG